MERLRGREGGEGAASTGLLVVVPPPEREALEEGAAEEAIARALRESEERGIRGKEITPFLLARVAELTGGASQRANVALLKNNAAVAAGIACALAAAKKS